MVKAYNKTGKLTIEQRAQADDIISEIYYLMANTCPFKRGSNGISDVLMRSQYSALGINMPHVKNGCVVIKTTKQIHDFVDKLNFDGFFAAAIDFCHCTGKYNFVVKIYLNNSETIKCIKDGHKEFRFVYDKGEPF